MRGHPAGHQAGGQQAPAGRGRPRAQGIEARCRPQPTSLRDRVADLGISDPATQHLRPGGQPELARKECALSFQEVREGSLPAVWHIEEYFMGVDVTSSLTGRTCRAGPGRLAGAF